MACNCLLTFGLILICAGTLFSFISNGTVHWVDYDDGVMTRNFGLYTWCVEYLDSGISRCDDIEDPDGYVIGTRSCNSIAIILAVIACVLSFIHLYKVSKRTASKSIVLAIVILCSIAVVSLIISNTVYGASWEDDDLFDHSEYELSISFGLNIVAAIGLMVAAILIYKSFDHSQQVQPQGGAIFINNYPGAQPAFVQGGQPVMMPPGYGQPTPAYGQPSTAYGQPAPGYGQPAPGYGQPAPGYGQPMAYSNPAYPGQPMNPAYGGQPQPFATAAYSATGQPQGNGTESTTGPPPPPAKY